MSAFAFSDAALWRRILIIPFNVSFVCSPLKPNKRAMNENLGDEIKDDIRCRQTLIEKLIKIRCANYKPRCSVSWKVAREHHKTKACEFIYYL